MNRFYLIINDEVISQCFVFPVDKSWSKIRSEHFFHQYHVHVIGIAVITIKKEVDLGLLLQVPFGFKELRFDLSPKSDLPFQKMITLFYMQVKCMGTFGEKVAKFSGCCEN